MAQFAGWAVTFYVAATRWGTPPDYVRYVPIITVFGLIITLGMRGIYKVTWDWSIGRRIFIVLLSCYVAGAAWKLSRFYTFR